MTETNSSGTAGPLVVELVGALIDDGGAFGRTLGEVIAREGVEVRPGSLDQVTGAGPSWALATLLEGHGRSETQDRMDALVREVVTRWDSLARQGRFRVVEGALVALRTAAAYRPVGLLTGLPSHVAVALLEAAGASEFTSALIPGEGQEGPPRSSSLIAWLQSIERPAADATALLTTAPGLLAAIGARCGDVVLVGEGATSATMLAERQVASLAAALD